MTQKIINDIRAFNRFYTDVIGLLDNHILNSRYSLPEARILYEIYHNKDCEAKYIRSVLHIDKGQLSRILKKLEKEKIITKKRSENDGRAVHLALTEKGRREFGDLDKVSFQKIEGLLALLSVDDKENLIYHMKNVREIM